MKPLRFPGFAIALSLFIAAHALADPTHLPLTDKVPADALIYVGWAGSDSLEQSYDASHLKAVLSASNFDSVIDQLIPQLTSKLRDPQATETIARLRQAGAIMWKHPAAFYARDLSGPADRQPKPSAALVCDAGGDSAALLALLQKLVADANGSGAAVGSTGTLVWVGAAGEQPDQVASSLSASASFTAVMGHLQTNSAVACYINCKSTLTKVDSFAGRDVNAKRIWPALRDALGLTNLSAIAFASGFDGADWMSSACLIAPAPRTGLLAAIEPAKPDPALLARVPESANLVSASRFDAGKFLDVIGAAFATDPDASKIYHMGLGAANMFLGRNLRQQIVGSLGDQWVIYASSPSNFVLMNKPTDPTVANDALTSAVFGICNAINVRLGQPGKPLVNLETQTIQGVSLVCANAGALKPSLAVYHGILYVGDSPQSVVAAATAPDSTQPDITLRPEFAAALKRLNAPSVSGFDFANLPRTVSLSYPMLSAGFNTLPRLAQPAGLRIPPIVLPPLDVVTANLSPSLGVNWADDTGIYSKEISPFPGSSTFGNSSDALAAVGAGAMVVAVLTPSLDRARETANRVKCASNQRQIGMAILLYSNDNHGNYPPDLGTLIKTEYVTAQVFVCPSGKTTVPANLKTPDQIAAWVNDNADYIYVGKGLTTTTARPNQIVLYEKPDAHDGDGMNFLYGDGHVNFQNMARAKQLIQQLQDGGSGAPGEHGL